MNEPLRQTKRLRRMALKPGRARPFVAPDD
jgi:hypothetical protein